MKTVKVSLCMALAFACVLLCACAAGTGKNTIRWNGDFFGVTLPAPDGRDSVCEYTVNDDSITVRIDGMNWDEFVSYCRKLESLEGWEAINDEDSAHFPDGPRDDGIVYFTGAYSGLPRINVRYNGKTYAEKQDIASFSMFVFKTW